MARGFNKLTSARVNHLRDDETDKYVGMHSDGGGLYLQVTKGGRSWTYRYKLNGRSREMGLGPLRSVGLAEARKLAAAYRYQHSQGIDPLTARNAERAKAALEAARTITFRGAAEQYLAANQSRWKNAKHAAQWRSTLETYAYPILGSLPVQDIDVTLVMKVLDPIWHEKTETASRVRGRIEAVLNWATVREYRRGDNPARWKGYLSQVLPERSEVQRPEHHAALPFSEIGAFMEALRRQPGIAARALEFTILTAARTGEVIGATWPEFNPTERAWFIPAERMKAGRVHRIPLSRRAEEILVEMDAIAQIAKARRETTPFVFPGGKSRKPLSNMAMLQLLKRMGRDDLTIHGFRSTFRDWVAERTPYPAEVAEMALAHTIANKAEAAYRRGDLLERRRRMMDDWATFCAAPDATTSATVVPLQRGLS